MSNWPYIILYDRPNHGNVVLHKYSLDNYNADDVVFFCREQRALDCMT